MKQVKLLLFSLIMLSSFIFVACDNEKEDEEKRKNVQVNHTYNDKNLTVLIINSNEEEVKVEIYARYNPAMLGASTEYIHDEVSVKAHDRLQKDYLLTGEMPNNMEISYKVY